MTCSQCGEIRARPMTTRVGSAGASRGLSVMENAIGYRTVYENMKAAGGAEYMTTLLMSLVIPTFNRADLVR